MNWSVLKLEPNLGKLEPAYREHVLKFDVAQATLIVITFNVFSLYLILTDYGFWGLSPLFYTVLLARLGAFAFSGLTLLKLQKTRSPQKAEQLLTLLMVLSILLSEYVNLMRPRDYMGYLHISSLFIFTIYLICPINFRTRLGLAALYTLFDFVNLNSKTIDSANWRATVITLLASNLLGVFISSLIYSYRRNNFLLLQREIKVNEQLKMLAMVDPLTNVKNRRMFLEQGESELERCHRHGHTMTLALIDLDQFKQVNDTLGHQAGDEVLQKFAEVVDRSTRGQDLFARIGGDEFGLLMPETEIEEARLVVERLSRICDNTEFQAAGQKVKVGMSVGLAHNQQAASIDRLMYQADQALYTIKRKKKDSPASNAVARVN
jgi:diguanylate cyclase (GGDEF)-like protein